ncbi:MAG TPA: hypothetical protein VFN36_02305 [Solirubrobacteraceae bacterium]|nr:hypothetical protein [Solirubrobacteraceae bacterium]
MLRGALGVVAVSAATMLANTSVAAAAPASARCGGMSRGVPNVGRFGGIMGAVNRQSGCLSPRDLQLVGAAGNTAAGMPPLIFHGGPVMGTTSTGPLVITPIFWNPTGHPMSSTYKSLITRYLSDVAAASGHKDNVFSIGTEYSGTDGTINYQVRLGTPINDTNPLPANSCKLMPADTANIYADNSGYNACIDDAQVIAETDAVVTAAGLPRDYGHIYALYLPRGVESCFYPGETATSANVCTINHEPSAGYCAYHSQASDGMVYANMPYPIYASPVGYTCGSDAVYPTVQTPNGNADADTEISPTSHELIEAETDPDTQTGWYDNAGYEIGDECAYIYGTPSGTGGQYYNQTINHDHYLTQEEFSNNSFFLSGGGCLQGENQVKTGS